MLRKLDLHRTKPVGDYRDVESLGSVPVCTDRSGRLDEPKPATGDRLPSRGEPSSSGTARRSTIAAER